MADEPEIAGDSGENRQEGTSPSKGNSSRLHNDGQKPKGRPQQLDKPGIDSVGGHAKAQRKLHQTDAIPSENANTQPKDLHQTDKPGHQKLNDSNNRDDRNKGRADQIDENQPSHERMESDTAAAGDRPQETGSQPQKRDGSESPFQVLQNTEGSPSKQSASPEKRTQEETNQLSNQPTEQSTLL